MNTKKLKPVLEEFTGPLSFGMFLRVARNSMGLSQATMAKKLGIARGTLCDLEKGRQLVSVKLALKVAKQAGLSPELAVKACLQDQVNKVRLGRKVELVA